MIEADFGGTGPAQLADAGDETGPGVRPPSPPHRSSTPEVIRAILAGIPSPAPVAPTLTVVRPDEPASAEERTLEDPGALSLASVDVVLPHIVESARAAGRSLTVAAVRPGPAATPGVRLAPAAPGAVADLAAALAVSLGPEHDLLSDGPGHLVVTSLGGSPRRDTTALMQRAAETGAPMFTWAAARFPRDAQSASELLDLARARVDGTEPVVERDRRSKAAAVWAAVAAALLVAAFAFIVHGHGTPRAAGGAGATGGSHRGASSLSGSGGSAGTGSVGSAGTGSAGELVSGGSGSGGGSGGAGSYSLPANGGAGTSGTDGNAAGSGSSTNGTGSTGSSGTGGGSTATSLPANTTATTIGDTTATTTGNTTGTTTVNNPTTTTTVCTYKIVLGQLICTVTGLLPGH